MWGLSHRLFQGAIRHSPEGARSQCWTSKHPAPELWAIPAIHRTDGCMNGQAQTWPAPSPILMGMNWPAPTSSQKAPPPQKAGFSLDFLEFGMASGCPLSGCPLASRSPPLEWCELSLNLLPFSEDTVILVQICLKIYTKPYSTSDEEQKLRGKTSSRHVTGPRFNHEGLCSWWHERPQWCWSDGPCQSVPT